MIPTCKVIIGDAMEELATLPEKSVSCVVTSPPYYGLRDYGVDGQLGLEATPAEYIEKMVAVFAEVWRVLRDDGTIWVNMGDSYSSNGGPGWQGKNGQRSDRRFTATRNSVGLREMARHAKPGLKPKDLMGMPWMLAFALRDFGWYLRRDIIWHKPNPMPESCRDRPTTAHEYIFLLSKSATYYYDQAAIREPASYNTHERQSRAKTDHKCAPDSMKNGIRAQKMPAGWAVGEHSHSAVDHNVAKNHRKTAGANSRIYQDRDPKHPSVRKIRNNDSFDEAMAVMPDDRNKRSVWTVASAPHKEAHFATFPPKLIEPCVLAGCPMGGTVLDPFGGSGTTAEVAMKHGRNAILIELNPAYGKLIEDRTARNGGQGVMPL
jgi:DNA modification methylase